MKIDVPDASILNFCLHSLALERITRVEDHPKYGYPPLGGINVFGGYGYNNVDTFQDTFNARRRLHFWNGESSRSLGGTLMITLRIRCATMGRLIRAGRKSGNTERCWKWWRAITPIRKMKR